MEPAPREAEVAAHRDGGNAERPGHLGGFQPFQLSEDENRPFALAQRGEGRFEPARELGAGPFTDPFGLRHFRVGFVRPGDFVPGDAPNPSPPIVDGVDCDLVDPRGERSPFAVDRQMAEDPEEHLLGDVFLIGGGNPEETNDAKNSPLVTQNERLERADITPTGGLDQNVVLRVVFGQKELLLPRTSTAITE